MNDVQKAIEMRELLGTDLGHRSTTYDAKDVILYALAIGAGAKDLELVFERDLKVIPTFSLTLGLWAVRVAGLLGAYDPTTTLHIGQGLVMRKPLPATATVDMSGSISAVWDKGSAALVEVTVISDYFDANYLIYAVGAGGFGGERGPRSSATEPDGDPSLHLMQLTDENQAALYRLTGDVHPVHIDPDVARSSGFDRPILHGLCTLGTVVRAMAVAADENPTKLKRLNARFTAPVYPGEMLEIDCWQSDHNMRFTSSVSGTGIIIQGDAQFQP